MGLLVWIFFWGTCWWVACVLWERVGVGESGSRSGSPQIRRMLQVACVCEADQECSVTAGSDQDAWCLVLPRACVLHKDTPHSTGKRLVSGNTVNTIIFNTGAYHPRRVFDPYPAQNLWMLGMALESST